MVLKKGENEKSYIVKTENGSVLKKGQKKIIPGGKYHEKTGEYENIEIKSSTIDEHPSQEDTSSASI